MRSENVTAHEAGFSAKYWAFHVAAVVVPLVPVWLSAPLARMAGLVMYVVSPAMRSKARHNLARVPGLQERFGILAHLFEPHLCMVDPIDCLLCQRPELWRRVRSPYRLLQMQRQVIQVPRRIRIEEFT